MREKTLQKHFAAVIQRPRLSAFALASTFFLGTAIVTSHFQKGIFMVGIHAKQKLNCELWLAITTIEYCLVVD